MLSILGGDYIGAVSIPGKAAGLHRLDGIMVGDQIITVVDYSASLSSRVDRTAEFSITRADEVTNAGGTDTTGRFLLLAWRRPN